ncbi:hypothetical protein BD410DRAFT_902868 [Rickenella mellea]|uniref:Uncharacterized protein n=1 Tax=Rickenella mellea TaxID=50990 RepID=A0A4Y7PHM2_9AGAM|nr:hypothetical protein BD410DRAFT_902868 [Rickenella mellea]
MAGPQDVFARRLFMNPPLASPMPTDILSDVPVHSSIQIHWRNLAPDSLWSLNLGETVTSAFLECLSRFPRLQEFKAYFKLSPAQRLTQPPSILNRDHAHFTHLKRLELTLELEPKLDDTLDENPHPLLAELFDGIRLPALTTLRLNGGGQGGLDPQWRPCINFIRRFKFTLEHLEIVLPSVLLPPHFLDSESFVNLKHLAHWLTRRLLRHWFIESPWEDMYYPTFYNHTHRSCTRN